MQTSITARHFELTSQLKDYVDRKTEKLEHYSHYITNLELILAKGSPLEEVEGKVHLKHELLLAVPVQRPAARYLGKWSISC